MVRVNPRAGFTAMVDAAGRKMVESVQKQVTPAPALDVTPERNGKGRVS